MTNKSSETAKENYGNDIHSKWGKKGGQAKVRKGLPVYLERLTPIQREEWYANRNLKRWGGNANKEIR